MEVRRLEFQTSPGGSRGDLGFKLTGTSADGTHLARVWVRRKRGPNRQVWTRYLPPVATSNTWEVRLHERIGTGSMALIAYRPDVLTRLAEEYDFPKSAETSEALGAIASEDRLFTQIRDWAAEVTAPGA